MPTPPEIARRMKRDEERMRLLLKEYDSRKAAIARKQNRINRLICVLAGTSLAWIALELSKFIGIKGGF